MFSSLAAEEGVAEKVQALASDIAANKQDGPGDLEPPWFGSKVHSPSHGKHHLADF